MEIDLKTKVIEHLEISISTASWFMKSYVSAESQAFNQSIVGFVFVGVFFLLYPYIPSLAEAYRYLSHAVFSLANILKWSPADEARLWRSLHWHY